MPVTLTASIVPEESNSLALLSLEWVMPHGD